MKSTREDVKLYFLGDIMMSHMRVGVDRPNSYSNSIHIIYFKYIFFGTFVL